MCERSFALQLPRNILHLILNFIGRMNDQMINERINRINGEMSNGNDQALTALIVK